MHVVADVGARVRKLFCECGGHELFAIIEGQLGGTKTECQQCQERYERERPMSPDEEDEAVERYLEYRERSEEY